MAAAQHFGLSVTCLTFPTSSSPGSPSGVSQWLSLATSCLSLRLTERRIAFFLASDGLASAVSTKRKKPRAPEHFLHVVWRCQTGASKGQAFETFQVIEVQSTNSVLCLSFLAFDVSSAFAGTDFSCQIKRKIPRTFHYGYSSLSSQFTPDVLYDYFKTQRNTQRRTCT